MEMLNTLLQGALGRKVPANFAAENYDYETALRDELKKIAGTRSQYERNKYDIFDLLARELDEEMPLALTPLEPFAEIIRVPQGTRLEFRTRVGKQRGKSFVTRATESGVYETFRLDRERFDVIPVTIGGAGYVDFERYMDGIEDIADVYEVIRDGMTDRLYEMVQEALLASWNHAGRPAANKVAVNGFDLASMRELCTTVSAYGAPVIYCSPEFAAEMSNAITFDTTVKVSDADLLDIRERGYVGRILGVPVIVMPQSFADDTNTKKLINPSFAFVIPTGKERLVKIGVEGEPYFREITDMTNGIHLQAYVKVGVGIVNRPNYWGIYYNAAIDAGEWADYNSALVTEDPIEP